MWAAALTLGPPKDLGRGEYKEFVQKGLSEEDHFQVCGEDVLANEAALGK